MTSGSHSDSTLDNRSAEVRRQDIDEKFNNVSDAGITQSPHCLDGPVNPTFRHKAQDLTFFAEQRAPGISITGIYSTILALLSRVGLREENIIPGHQRIRWKNVSAHNPESNIHSALS
jgi:hypothetical protein